VYAAAHWTHLLAPAADLAGMSNPKLLGALLVRCLRLAPGRAAEQSEVEQYDAFVQHVLELCVRLMRKSAAAIEAAQTGEAIYGRSSDNDRISSSASSSSSSSSQQAAAGFAPWQSSNMLYCLARAGVQPGHRWERAFFRSTQQQLVKGEWGAQELSKTAFALSRLKLGGLAPYMWRNAFLQAWSSWWSEATPHQLSSMLAGVAALRWRVTPGWVADARTAVARVLPVGQEQDVAWLVWGLAVLNDRMHVGGMDPNSSSSSINGSSSSTAISGGRRAARPEVPLALAIDTALTRHMPYMSPRLLALSADSLARMHARQDSSHTGPNPQTVQQLADCAQHKMQGFTFQELTELLASLAKMRGGRLLPPGWPGTALAQLQVQLPACRPPALAAAVWAIGTLGWRQQRAAAGRLLWRSERQLRGMSSRDLSTLAVGLVRLEHRPPKVWLFNFLSAFEEKMEEAGAQALSTVAWALARLAVRPARSGQWTEKLVAAAVAPETLQQFSAQEMALLVYALGAWKHVPRDGAHWALLQRRLRELLPEASARSVAMAAAGLGRLRWQGGGRTDGSSSSQDSSSSSQDSSSRQDSSNSSRPGPPVEPQTVAALLQRTRPLLAATTHHANAPPRQRPSDAFSATDLANTGKGLALLGAQPDGAWLAAWRLAVDTGAAQFDGSARDSALWATSVLEGRAEVGAAYGYYAGDGGDWESWDEEEEEGEGGEGGVLDFVSAGDFGGREEDEG